MSHPMGLARSYEINPITGTYDMYRLTSEAADKLAVVTWVKAGDNNGEPIPFRVDPKLGQIFHKTLGVVANLWPTESGMRYVITPVKLQALGF